jgi:hypothetical protein
MGSAIPLHNAPALSTGMGELDAAAAADYVDPPNPNAALNQFKVADPNGGNTPVFDAAAWNTAVTADMSWAEMSWSEMSWAEMSWAEMSWAEMSWSEMSWAEMSWAEMSWAEMSWNEVANTDLGPLVKVSAADKAAVAADSRLTP